MPPKPQLTLTVKRVLKSGMEIQIKGLSPKPLIGTIWPRCRRPSVIAPVTRRLVRSYVKLLGPEGPADLVIEEVFPGQRRTTDSTASSRVMKKKKKKGTAR